MRGRRLKRRNACATRSGAIFDPMSLAPRLWLDAANFDGTDWTDSSGNGFDFTGTASVSTDGANGYAAVYLDGTKEITGPSWHTVFGSGAGVDPTGAWEVVICFNPDPLTINAEGVLSAQRAGLTKPQLFGAGLRGVALMRSATRTHVDGIEATRRPRAATWEEALLGDGHHHYFATPIIESATQITRHGRSGDDSWASGYKTPTWTLNQNDATVNGSATLSIGGNSSGHYTGKISHIFAFNRKLTNAEAADLSGWIADLVGADYLPKPIGVSAATDPYGKYTDINFDLPNAVGINSGMVVDIDVGTASDIGDGGFPRPPIGWEMYYPGQRPDLVTAGGHTGLRFTGANGDYGFPTSATAYSYPGSYCKYTALFGPSPSCMGYVVVNLEQFASGGTVRTDWGTIFGWLSAPYTNIGMQYKKIAGNPTVEFFDAEVAVPENSICFIEFGLKTVSGNTVSHIRVNNGSVVKYTHAGLLNLSIGDLIGLGCRDYTPSTQHILYRMKTFVDAQALAPQQTYRDEIAADFGLTLATTDLFA